MRTVTIDSAESSPYAKPGILTRISTAIYRYLVAEVCFILATAPGAAGLLLLDRSASNIPLFALCLLPFAPAFSALIGLRGMNADNDDTVWPRFWRVWTQNVVDVLWIWVPILFLSAILSTTLTFGSAAGVGEFFLVAAGVMLLGLSVFAMHAIVITSFFNFRARDTTRLALYYLAARPLSSLGAFSLLVLATAAIAFFSDVAFMATAVGFAFLIRKNARTITDNIQSRFISPDDRGSRDEHSDQG